MVPPMPPLPGMSPYASSPGMPPMAAPPGVMSASPVMEGTTRWTIAASGRDEVKPGIKVATDDGHEFDLDDYPVFEPEEADAEASCMRLFCFSHLAFV